MEDQTRYDETIPMPKVEPTALAAFPQTQLSPYEYSTYGTVEKPAPPPPFIEQRRMPLWAYGLVVVLVVCLCIPVYVIGVENGYHDGYTNGQNDGFTNGKQSGYVKGKADGYARGETDGYDKGVADGASKSGASYTKGNDDAFATLYAYLSNSCGKDMYGYYQDATGAWTYTCIA